MLSKNYISFVIYCIIEFHLILTNLIEFHIAYGDINLPAPVIKIIDNMILNFALQINLFMLLQNQNNN